MKIRVRVFSDAKQLAREAARRIATESRAAVSARGKFIVALSGGRTPGEMLRELAEETVSWGALEILQVDERVAPAGDPDRNLTQMRESLLTRAPIRAEQIHPMPVESVDLKAAAAQYTQALRDVGGMPPVLDLIHLGLGRDGHTASLVPGDVVLDVIDADVAVTNIYQGRRRMTLTYPVINRARNILWVVSGSEKAEILARVCSGDRSIPAGRVSQEQAVILVDRAAATQLDPGWIEDD